MSAKLFQTWRIFRYAGGGLTLLGVGYIMVNPNERRTLQAALGSAVRFSRSIRIGVTISVDYWISPIFGQKISEIHQRSADRIVKGCMQNGGIYIKLGQGLGAINHILPKEYIKSLAELQDKCLTRGINELQDIFLEDFGKKPEEVFDKIEPEPVAAASLAQVYKGTTKEGKSVAIKVQYIDLRDRFKSDMKMLNYLLQAITFMHPKFNLHWVIDEMYKTLEQELDFEIEGKNAEICAEHLKKYKFAYVPKVYWDLSTKRILTSEWIDGLKISNVEGLKNSGLKLSDIDRKFVTLMAEQVFHTGFVHADPHPGNVLIRKGKDGKAQIVLIDHGLYEHLPEKIRISLCNFWESMVFKDHKAMKMYAQQLGVKDHVLFAEMITQAPFSIPLPKTNMDGMTAEEYMTRQAQERFDKITETLRAMPNSLLLVIRNLNTVRSIIKEHGECIDRYRLMARIAVRGKYNVNHSSYRQKVVASVSKVKFESQLWINSFVQWLTNLYFKFLQLCGYDVEKTVEVLMI